jgi:hypothetical protein
MYACLELLMGSYKEEEAVAMIQELFDFFQYKHSKKLSLVKCKKKFISHCGVQSQLRVMRQMN